MNITSKRLDKIKKTKNQSKRRIHYKNKKKNGKEKNRRKNRKYNKSTGKYRKTHKRKKRAYDLKNKSLKFKENQPVNKSATLKIITTDKPVETLQTGGGLWENFKKLFKSANTKKKEEIDGLKDEIFAIISKENDNVRDFYEWYINELIKIAFKTDGEDQKYTDKRTYYDNNLKYKPFGKAIKNLKNDPDLYTEANKIHLITIFKLTLTDHMTHLKKLFSSDVGDFTLEKYIQSGNRYVNWYHISFLIVKMKKILKAAKAEKKKAEIDELKDEIFAIIKDDDYVKGFYKWYIDELLKIAFAHVNDNSIYKPKRTYYDNKLKDAAFNKAIHDLQDNLKKNPDLYHDDNKKHLIDIFKLTLTDDMTHLKNLFSDEVGKIIKNNDLYNIDAGEYRIVLLISEMNKILDAAKEAKKKAAAPAEDAEAPAEEAAAPAEEAAAPAEDAAAPAEEAAAPAEEAAAPAEDAAAPAEEAAAPAEDAEAPAEEAAAPAEEAAAKNKTAINKAKKKAVEEKTEEEKNNINANIETPEFNDFLKKVKKDNGPYSDFLKADEGNPFKNLIENSKVMEGGAGEEGEEGGNKEVGKKETNDGDNLVDIYVYLMNKDNQEKIRKSLTETTNTEELKNFDAMIESIRYARFAQATYAQSEHISNIMLLKPGVAGADTAVISTDTSDLKTTDALVDFGNFEQHVKVTKNEMNKDDQSGAIEEKED